MTTRPRIESPKEYGNATSFWVEYPSGLLDLSQTKRLDSSGVEPIQADGQIQIEVDGDRTVRVDPAKTAFVIIDMQNFFLHPELRNHPMGLACVDPLLKTVPYLREKSIKTLWVNWGLTDHELTTIPPSLVRGMQKSGQGGLGDPLPGDWGRRLMRGERNSALYGPLQDEYLKGESQGMDVWIHKNRMSAIWGPQTALDLYLQENGVTTLFFAGVNADQCVLGSVIDAYYRGYDIILVKDGIATTSPAGGLENVIYNAGNSYGFTTDSERILKAQ